MKLFNIQKLKKTFFVLIASLNLVGVNGQGNVTYIPFYTQASFNNKSVNTNKSVGVTLGSANVSNGAASYAIPIASPPKPENGVPDVQLSLSYSSMRGDGCAGFGWDISGMSGIHRTQKTIANNGITGPSCTSEEEYLWDGNKLMLLNSNNQNNWATENETFSTITSFRDNNGNIYIVSENGGGDINHPQLWVYAPSTTPNQAPTAIALTNTVPSIIENSITTPAVRVADILLTDDGLGTNTYSLSGADANNFQITASSLFIKPGTVLDFETKSTYNVTVNVDDTTVGATPDASVNFVLSVTDLVNETPQLPNVTISEVAPWGSGNSPAAADWFEVTNNGTTALNISGWKVDDSSNSFAASLALTGITSIAPGESVIFLESSASNPAATVVANFKSLWFGANPPASLQVGTYQGSGIGLSTGGDAVNLYDASGVLQANVIFGASPTVLFKTFNNAVGLNNTTISLLSEVGVNDAFVAVNDVAEIGSPGSVGRLFISEVAPWSSGNSPVGADWFEVTNTKAVAVDITGWKVDDSSQSPAAAVALNGITSINPGESVIFIETNDLPGKTTAFLNNWFGTNPTGGLRIGNYTGSGIGLGTGGDQVNLYNTTSSTPQTSVLFGSSP
ncbi:MAG: lamin tail domain-containing protein, partial [Chitinophagales bacterium]